MSQKNRFRNISSVEFCDVCANQWPITMLLDGEGVFCVHLAVRKNIFRTVPLSYIEIAHHLEDAEKKDMATAYKRALRRVLGMSPDGVSGK